MAGELGKRQHTLVSVQIVYLHSKSLIMRASLVSGSAGMRTYEVNIDRLPLEQAVKPNEKRAGRSRPAVPCPLLFSSFSIAINRSSISCLNVFDHGVIAGASSPAVSPALVKELSIDGSQARLLFMKYNIRDLDDIKPPT